MKTGMLCVLCCVALLAAGPGHAAQEVNSKITSVTVYSDRALVTRTATLAVKPGEYEFVFAGLPPILDSNSVRASGAGSAQARLLGLDTKVIATKEAPEERVQKLRNEIRALEDRIEVVTDELAVLAEQKDFITQMKLVAQQAAAQQFQFKEVNTAEWETVLAFVGAGLTGLMQSARERNMALRELNKELEIRKAELGQIDPEAVVKTKRVTVAVEALSEGTLELALDYVVLGAAWAPLYDARADLDTGTVELTYYGTVAQRTGEDWTNVKLALSTAQPAVGAQVPMLHPWFLDSGWRRVETEGLGGDEFGGGFGGEFGEPEPDVEGDMLSRLDEGFQAFYVTPGAAYLARPALAEIEERGTSAVFEVKKTETIPSDGEPHRTTIGIVKLDGKMRYTVLPKVQRTAYVEAEVTNTSELRLLSGDVHVFIGPDFVGEAFLKGVAPGEQFELSLGPEDRIKVERETLKDRTKVSEWRNKVAVRNTTRITVENYTGKPAAVVVRDQVPVSKDADAKVKLMEATDKIKPDEATGELKWEFDLAPGAKKELTFEFEFSFPEEAFDYYRCHPASELIY